MENNQNPNVDIEALALIVGVSRTAEISKISEDAIMRMLGRLHPENHGFFYFLKDCLIHMISKIGEEETAKKLEISLPVVQTIKKHASKVTKVSRALGRKSDRSEHDELKNDVIDFYNNCKSITKTAEHFKIKKEKAISYVINSSELID